MSKLFLSAIRVLRAPGEKMGEQDLTVIPVQTILDGCVFRRGILSSEAEAEASWRSPSLM